ncbi:MAG: signal peptidase II [Myxococcales bacterium]|nr:signal peptidase II [Myxococcales bacterium]
MSEDPKDEGAPEADEPDAPRASDDEASGDEAPKGDGTAERRRVRRRDDRPRVVEAEEEPAAPAPLPKPNYLFLVITSFLFLVADLGSKEWAAKRLEGPNAKIVVIDGYWAFDLAKNKGGAWGIFGNQPDYVRLPFFFLISAVAVVFIVSLYKKLEKRQVALKWALPLVLGGALGNLADRIRHQHVIDFIDWYYVNADGKATHWPTFNVADVWIVAGVILMGIDMFTPRRKLPTRAPAALRGRQVGAKKPVTASADLGVPPSPPGEEA